MIVVVRRSLRWYRLPVLRPRHQPAPSERPDPGEKQATLPFDLLLW